jgi:hypothetical protein
VDTYCLGVKNTLGPRNLNDWALCSFVREYFGAFEGDSVAAPLELAQHVVFGAVEYARGLGFEPHPDFGAATAHLGTWQGPSAITFGDNDKPVYIAGALGQFPADRGDAGALGRERQLPVRRRTPLRDISFRPEVLPRKYESSAIWGAPTSPKLLSNLVAVGADGDVLNALVEVGISHGSSSNRTRARPIWSTLADGARPRRRVRRSVDTDLMSSVFA